MGPSSPDWTEHDIEAALERNAPLELLYIPIVVSMNADSLTRPWVENICCRLAQHDHFQVRANAILGFGHVARVCGALDLAAAVPLIQAGLNDDDETVKAHAFDAASELYTYLDVIVPGYVPVYWALLEIKSGVLFDPARLVTFENEINQRVAPLAEADGHEIADDEVAFWYFSSNPIGAFELAKPLLAEASLLDKATFSYRKQGSSEFTIIWPEQHPLTA